MPVLLNSRHERFAQALYEGLPAHGAYVQAGYAANRGNAVRLKTKESVQKRLVELQGMAAEDADVTVDTLVRELESARVVAMTQGNPSAAVAATLGKAKLLGLMVERKEKGAPGDFDVAGRIVARWRENLARLTAEEPKLIEGEAIRSAEYAGKRRESCAPMSIGLALRSTT